MKYELRPYQVQAVNGARERIARGARSCLIVAPTGAGKTIIACNIVESAIQKSTRTLFLAHRKELIEQCSAKLDEIGVPHGIIKAGNKRVDPRALVQVASVQTLGRRMDSTSNDFGLIIVDEAHHAVADSYGKIITANPQANILGLTATPYRTDGKGLGDMFATYVEVATVEQLIRDGFLVPSRVFVGMKADLTGVKKTAGDYNLKALGEAVNKPRLVGNIVEAWTKHASERLTVCFTATVEHSMTVAHAFRCAGVAAEHLDGETPADERTAILKRFAVGETRVLCNCAVLTEGWDCPQAAALILARPTKSRCMWRQMAGRVLRPAPGKTDCIILDHGNCTEEHGFITDPDVVGMEGNQEGKAAAKRRCKNCHARYAGTPKHCPQCGILLETESGEREDAALEEDTSYQMRETTERPAKPALASGNIDAFIYLRDMNTAHEKSYKPSWAAIRYKSRTGKWPPKELEARCPHKTKFVTIDGKFTKAWA